MAVPVYSVGLILWPFLSTLVLEGVGTCRHKPTGCKINSGQTVYVKMFAEREGGDRTNGRGASPLATVLRTSSRRPRSARAVA